MSDKHTILLGAQHVIQGLIDGTTAFIFFAVLPVSSLAGMANLLRSDIPITRRAVFSAVINSGLFGVAIAAWMIHTYGIEARWLILSTSVLAGLGGNALLDFVLESVKNVWRSYIEREANRTDDSN